MSNGSITTAMGHPFTTTVLVGAAMALSPMAARAAATCDQFKAAMIEGAAMYQAPAPKFVLWEPSPQNVQYFRILIFDDAQARMSCSDGEVGSFIADTDSTEPRSRLHAGLLAGMGLHAAYGVSWGLALEMRDQLVDLAKASDAQMAVVHFEGGKVSLVISASGMPSYKFDTDLCSRRPMAC